MTHFRVHLSPAMSLASCVALLLAAFAFSSFKLVLAQSPSDPVQDTWPQVYPGMPTGDYSPEWQDCMS